MTSTRSMKGCVDRMSIFCYAFIARHSNPHPATTQDLIDVINHKVVVKSFAGTKFMTSTKNGNAI